MNKNIIKYYIYSATSNLLFFLPIVYILFQNKGLTISQIFLIEALFSIAVVIFEVPTGALADYFGKKISLILGTITWIISCLMFNFVDGFFLLSLSYIMWALGAALLSGADTALLYDLLHQNDQKSLFKKHQGNAKLIGQISIAISSLLGGYISSIYGMNMTFILSAAAFFIMLFMLIGIEHNEKNTSKEKKYIKIITESFLIIKRSSTLLRLFAQTAVFMVIIKISQPSAQMYMELSKLDIKYFGIAGAYFFLMGAIGSKLSNKFHSKLGNYSYLILSIIVILGTTLIGNFVFKLGFLIFGLLYFAANINSILAQHDILEITPQDKQSTIMSFNNLFDRLLFAVFSIGWGIGSQHIGLTNAYLILSIICGLIFVLLLLKYHNKN